MVHASKRFIQFAGGVVKSKNGNGLGKTGGDVTRLECFYRRIKWPGKAGSANTVSGEYLILYTVRAIYSTPSRASGQLEEYRNIRNTYSTGSRV